MWVICREFLEHLQGLDTMVTATGVCITRQVQPFTPTGSHLTERPPLLLNQVMQELALQ